MDIHVAALPRVMHLAKDTKPLRCMTHFNQPIHLFQPNRHIVPSSTYTKWAAAQLCEDPRFRILHLNESDATDLVRQEWRTHMVRSVYQARLNPHEILDGPVVVRSRNGVVRVQLALDGNDVADAIATVTKSPTKRKAHKKNLHQKRP
ncbi:Aste57867_7885 [Aphanomyces stellatus]|uniref:Aste57867_7885 protein n=1 Tax=Aphanomyces stellatus TaxID=120398 RepID=A0A485KIW9_9STRA|nr:hypothetical protein As57867_007855 [Aphanomyces stellatus]VFT84778.1 Aste57867_7885 [Aphanomyces stellatus]